MGRMTWRVGDLERSPARFYLFAATEQRQQIFGYRFNLPPQSFHGVAVETGRARHELAWVDDMRRAPLVDEHPHVGVAANECPRCPRVVEMDVCEKELRDIGETNALRLQSEL